MKKTLLFVVVLAVLVTGCGDSNPLLTPVQAPPQTRTITVPGCFTFDFPQEIRVNMAGPVFDDPKPNPANMTVFELQSDGHTWQMMEGLNGLHFNHDYLIVAVVNNCLSRWYGFHVGPPNPDASGAKEPKVVTPAPIPVPVPTPEIQEPWCEATQDTRWNCPVDRR